MVLVEQEVKVMRMGRWSDSVGMCSTVKSEIEWRRGNEQIARSITDWPCGDINVKAPSGSPGDLSLRMIIPSSPI